MTLPIRLPLAATGLVLLALAGGPALAADTDVVAKVGAEEITEGDLNQAAAELAQQFAQLPPEQRKLAVLSALIDIKALAQEAEAGGLQDDPVVQNRIEFLRERALHNAYFEKNGVDAITDEQLKARYDQEIARVEPAQEVHARHILLKTKEEAEAVIDELDAGADFETVAKEKSTGPTGPQGGDLGFFGPGQMVPAFEKAAFALEPGQYTKEPVETQFGWHVIKVEEKRTQEPPAFEQVKDQVRQVVMREKYMDLVQAARDELTVEYVDPEIKAQVEALEQGIEAGATGSGTQEDAGEAAPATPEAPAAAE